MRLFHFQYSGTDLYNQLYYYHKIFDISQPVYKRNHHILLHILSKYPYEIELEECESLNLLSDLLSQCSRDMIAAYNTLKEAIDRQLRRNKFSCVNITGIFSGASSNAAMFGGAGGTQEDFDELGALSDDTDKEI